MTTWLLIIWATSGGSGPVEVKWFEVPNHITCETNRKNLTPDMYPGNLSLGAMCVPLKERSIPKLG